MTTMELISPLATAARSKFWEIKHVLKAQGHLFKRIRIMQRTVAASAMWCISMIPPDRGALGYCNTVQIQLIVWMMGISKGANEDWGSFRMRAWRAARAMLHRAGVERWSTVWLRRFWQYAGHRARGGDQQHPVISSVLEGFRTKSWWEEEKRKPSSQRMKHVHHFARLMQIESWLDDAAGGPWRMFAKNRSTWKAWEANWISNLDPPWASGRQASLEF